MATETHLPDHDVLELASYKLGLLMSDLDCMRTDLKKHQADEAARMADEARVAAMTDREQLAHVIVFAADLLAEAEVIRELAQDIQQLALTSYHEADSASTDFHAYRARVGRWHEAEAIKDRRASVRAA